MANLLTQEDKKILARRDKLTIVLVYILGGLFILAVGLVFLVPSYFLSEYKLEGVENRLDLLKASISAKKNEEINLALNQTRSLVSVLQEESHKESLGGIIAELVSYASPGIYIRNFSVAKVSEGGLSLTVKGEASTRSQLLGFVEALKDDPRFSNVNLPIGVLARERNIEFNLSFQATSLESISSEGVPAGVPE